MLLIGSYLSQFNCLQPYYTHLCLSLKTDVMRKILYLFVLAVGMAACQDSSSDYDSGVIVNYDMTLCACCGGYFIEINGHTYRFDSADIPAGHSDINFNASDLDIPIKVLVKWKPKENRCMDDQITVSDLRRRL
jgi:hypothetical protein